MEENNHGIVENNVEDAAFDAELDALMQADTSGKKKKKKKRRLGKVIDHVKGWSKKRKIITAVGTVIVLFFVFNSMGGGKTAPQTMVTTTPIQRADIIEDLTVSGPVSGTDSVDVVSNLHAEVLELMVKEGDRVEKGQLLATVDSTDIQKEVDIAQNAYELAVNTYNEQQIAAENGYAKAQQDYQAAKADFDRTNVLFQGGSVSQVELETAQRAMDDASRHLRTFFLKDGKPVANESYALQIQSAEFELEKAKTALENTQITSPIAGTVVRVNAKVGRFADKIEDDKPMFIIENLDVLEMKINVSEYSIGKIQVGQEAIISADILNGETVTGMVTAISPTGEEKGGGSTERVIPTTIRIDDTDSSLIAGITARARITLNESKDTLVVPISAVLAKEDGNYIATVEQNVIRLIKVETGVENDLQIEIFLPENEANLEGVGVVTTPNAMMTDGMTVAVMPLG